MLTILFFALALSLDGFGVGLSYSLRKIELSLLPLIIICSFSVIAITFSMVFGRMFTFFLSEQGAIFCGALILILVGSVLIMQQFFSNPGKCIFFKILQEPVCADLNSSGKIDLREALVLGFALAMDALGAGLGAAMSGYSLLATPLLVGMAEFMMINLGITLGKVLQIKQLKKLVTILPGTIIIVLGLTKLFSL